MFAPIMMLSDQYNAMNENFVIGKVQVFSASLSNIVFLQTTYKGGSITNFHLLLLTNIQMYKDNFSSATNIYTNLY